MKFNLMKKNYVVVLLLVLAAIGIVVAWQWQFFHSQVSSNKSENAIQEPDPRLLYAGPFRNIHPRVKYVGVAVCAECHPEIVEKYRRHPMGRSLAPVARTTGKNIYGKENHNPFEAFNSLFSVDRKGKRVFHRQVRHDGQGKPIFEYTLPISYEVGSGAHGKSFLSVREGGYVYMSPITWYTQKGIWDISPGVWGDIQHGRRVVASCLYCHCNKARVVEHTINRYKTPVFAGHAIGCERCHGPGELHYNNAGSMKPLVNSEYAQTDPKHPGQADFSIVNPRHLPPKLRDAICEQCHLEGEVRIVRRDRDMYDFRPGLPLESCWSVFVGARHTSHEMRMVSHVEQMHASRCWQKTSGANKLTCVSCHDPHSKPSPERRIAFYRQRCLNCHDATPDRQDQHVVTCAMPVSERRTKSRQDNCIACHMPNFRPEDITHSAATDHRVIIPKRERTFRPSADMQTNLPIVHFHVGALAEQHKSFSRDLAIGLTELTIKQKPSIMQVSRGLSLLEQAIAEEPQDWLAWESKGHLLNLTQNRRGALRTYEHVLENVPSRERSLLCAADLALALGKLDKAETYLRKLVIVNPWESRYHGNYAQVLSHRENWPEAAKHARKARDLEPGYIPARLLLMQCLLHTGHRAEAAAELSIIRRLDPAHTKEHQKVFEDSGGK